MPQPAPQTYLSLQPVAKGRNTSIICAAEDLPCFKNGFGINSMLFPEELCIPKTTEPIKGFSPHLLPKPASSHIQFWDQGKEGDSKPALQPCCQLSVTGEAKLHLDKAQHWSIASSHWGWERWDRHHFLLLRLVISSRQSCWGFLSAFWLLFKAAYKCAAVAAVPASTQNSILWSDTSNQIPRQAALCVLPLM